MYAKTFTNSNSRGGREGEGKEGKETKQEEKQADCALLFPHSIFWSSISSEPDP